MIPASVLVAFTDPVLWAITVPAGRNRGSFSLSSHAFRWSSIALQLSADAAFEAWIISRSWIDSLAVVDPRPYFFVRSGAMLVVLPLNTFALIRVFGQPRPAMSS